MTVFATMESRAPRAQLRAKGRGPLSGGGGRATDSMGDQRALVLWKGMRARLATTARAATASRTGQASLDMPGGGVWRPSLSERGRTLQRGTAFQVSCASRRPLGRGNAMEGTHLLSWAEREYEYSKRRFSSSSRRRRRRRRRQWRAGERATRHRCAATTGHHGMARHVSLRARGQPRASRVHAKLFFIIFYSRYAQHITLLSIAEPNTP